MPEDVCGASCLLDNFGNHNARLAMNICSLSCFLMFLLLCDAQAGTPGCTKEACKFRDEYGKFVDAECEVFGISSDTPEANAAFAKKERLPFPLLTDQNDFLRKSFGIKGNVFGMLKGRQVSSIVHALAYMHDACYVSTDATSSVLYKE